MRFQTRLVSRGAFALGALGVAVALHAGTPPERLFLQQLSPHGVTVKWRGGDAQSICYSTEMTNLYKSNWPRSTASALNARFPPPTLYGAPRSRLFMVPKSRACFRD